MRIVGYCLALVVAFTAIASMSWMSAQYFRYEEQDKAQGRLSLYQSSVRGELSRFSHLSYVLARDPFVMQTTETGQADVLNQRLTGFAQQAGLDAIYLIGQDGITIAASNAHLPESFVGEDYAFRPYFKDALNGQQARFYGIGATTGLPGYFIADPVRGAGGQIRGVIVIKIDLSNLQDSWQTAGEHVLLSNADGVVILASEPEWLYRTLAPLSPATLRNIERTRQFPGQSLAALDWRPLRDGAAQIDGEDWLHLTSSALPHGWQLHYFADDDRALAKSWLATGLVVITVGGILFAMLVQRNRRIGAALRRSEEKEAELRETNDRLAIEIEERRSAERRLRRTREELERASRLAALGRLAASVTHELGQPIAAMRNHLVAADIAASGRSGGAGMSVAQLATPLSGLVTRMEAITRQLKFFARGDEQDLSKVDLSAALRTALDLVAPNLAKLDLAPVCLLPDAPVWVMGNRLRLEQAMTNLLRNALDAMEGEPQPELILRLTSSATSVCLEIEDRGHGLGDATLAELQEPFVTTRESGRGMGLGLAITTSILNDHSAELSAYNRPGGGGCVFRVDFPLNDPMNEREQE